jgi:hypothetical protein
MYVLWGRPTPIRFVLDGLLQRSPFRGFTNIHGVWLGAGLLLLIFGLGVITVIGGIMGIATWLTGGFQPGGIPNQLMTVQIVLVVFGVILTLIGLM